MKKIIIVAYDKNRAIGAGLSLPWQGELPTDMRFFRDTTTGGAIIMGRKTFQSIGRPLPSRQNIVLTREQESIDGVTVAHSLEEAYEKVLAGREIFIIGGGQLYVLALDSVDTILATEIDAEFPGADVFFPAINPAEWRETSRVHHNANERDKYNFDFVTYERI